MARPMAWMPTELLRINSPPACRVSRISRDLRTLAQRVGRGLLRKSRSEGPSRSRRGFEDHAIPLTLQKLNGAMADTLRMATLVVVGPRLLVGGLARQQVVRGHQHRMRHGDDRLLMAAVSHHA